MGGRGTLSQFEEAGLEEEGREGWEGWGTLSQFEEAGLKEEGWEGWGTLHHSCSLKGRSGSVQSTLFQLFLCDYVRSLLRWKE